MKIKMLLILACIAYGGGFASGAEQKQMVEQMKQSCVYLEVSSYSYEQRQPWKPADVVQNYGYAVAVGPYEVLTTAWNVTDAAMLKVRRFAQNEYIPAAVKVVDYEMNLCLLELDKEKTSGPFKPLKFSEDYNEGAELKSYWLSSGGHLTTGRGFLDRAEVRGSTVSYARMLNYMVSNTSEKTNRGQLYCDGEKAVGIASWSDGNQVGLIPAVTINRFLKETAREQYRGFAVPGFEAADLLDPTMRAFLKMPEQLKHGTYVSKVYTIGTGSKELKEGDVILEIAGNTLNPYGRYAHKDFDRISFENLLAGCAVGDEIEFKVWREGKEQSIKVAADKYAASQMLVPFYEFGEGPEYLVTGGFVFQKLTRDYLRMWGDDFPGKVGPHLVNYYFRRNEPSEQRREIVLLSYVLPHEINLGYQQLGQMVVSEFNGMKIKSMADLLDAKKLNPDSKFDVVKFEMDYPDVVLPREQLGTADMVIQRLYRIPQTSRIR